MLKDPDAHFENNFGPIEVNTSYIIMATECSAEDFRVFAEQLAAYADKSSEIFCVINNYPDFGDACNGLREADKRFFEGKSLFDNEFACTIDFDSIRSDRLVICKVPEIFDNYRVSETAAADSELTKPSLPDEFAHLTVLMKRKSSMAHFYCSHFSDLMFGIYGTQTLSGLECPVNLPLLFTSYYAQYINDGDVPKLPEEFALPKSFFSPCLPDDYEDAVSKITDVITWTHDPLMNPVAGISAFEKAQRQLNGVWKSACSLIHLIPFEFANKVARQTTSPDNSVFYYNGTTTDQRDYRFDASVIIPVYNMENYIAECLDSVLAQRDITIQVICVNDGSTDNSLDVLLGYAYNDGRITVISQLNEGASGARNRAIDFATGDFLAFMDPDDFYPNDHVLADLIRSARRKGVPLCGGTLACVDTDTEEYLDIYQREAVHYMYETEEYRTFGQDQFDYGWIRFIYSKELFTNGKNRFPHLSFYEDPLFLMNIVTQVERYYVLPEVVYCYRINYKERDWQRWQVEDVLKGIKKNLDAAKKYGYSELYSTLIKRLEDDYYAPIMKFKHAPEILELLSQIQAGLDVSMIEKAKKLDFGQYLIRPLRDLALSAPAPEPGPPDVALVRMARRLSDSSAYHLSQKAFLGLKRRLGIEE
ncbi:MAG: glycosyltransferase [Eggerthellaceae bacterium]|nr:glycosyltransferase [Eggerthellaceae bacterium]